MTYLGDIDSSGIPNVDRLSQLLRNPVELLDIQTPNRVNDWLVRFDKESVKRTKELKVKNPLLIEEMDSIHTFGKFVEQEQLIQEYEEIDQRMAKVLLVLIETIKKVDLFGQSIQIEREVGFFKFKSFLCQNVLLFKIQKNYFYNLE